MKRTTIGIAIGLLFSVGAQAQTVSVPCAEFVEVTGRPMACDKIPVLKMSQAKWDAEKAAAQERNSPEADLPPWKRSGKGKAPAAEAPVANGCDMPPWKRPEGLKCY